MTIYNQISSNRRKTLLIMFLFVVLVTILGYVFSALTNLGYAGIILAFIISSLSAVGSYYYSDKLVLAISGAKEIRKGDYPYLYRIVENLCIGAGLPIPKIYLIKDNAINAFATGRNPEHSAIVFTEGAVSRLENEELEGVAAHELSHIKNYDTRLMVIVVILVGVIALLSDWIFRIFLYGDGDESDRKKNGFIILLYLIIVAVSPLVATLIKLAVSRNREYMADASAALLTRYPEGLARALEKISMDNKSLKVANKATAHLYIANPLKNRKYFANLFNTHPPIQERIRRLREM